MLKSVQLRRSGCKGENNSDNFFTYLRTNSETLY